MKVASSATMLTCCTVLQMCTRYVKKLARSDSQTRVLTEVNTLTMNVATLKDSVLSLTPLKIQKNGDLVTQPVELYPRPISIQMRLQSALNSARNLDKVCARHARAIKNANGLTSRRTPKDGEATPQCAAVIDHIALSHFNFF